MGGLPVAPHPHPRLAPSENGSGYNARSGMEQPESGCLFEESVMAESNPSAEAERLFKKLEQSGLAFNRKEAVEKIEKLSVSSEALVTALVQAREFDDNEAVRNAAAEALSAPAHKKILDGDPELEQRAAAARKKRSNFSLFSLLSYAFAILSVLIVYLDLFIIDPRISVLTNPLGLGVGPTVINSAILLVGSFLLPLAGFILGILAARQYDRKIMLGIIGLAGNALILLATSYTVISR
jgi:hypothetical protein